MRSDLAGCLTALPRLHRGHHEAVARRIESMLDRGERVLAVTSGRLAGGGSVLAAATDRRVLVADRHGWSTTLPGAQITCVSLAGSFGRHRVVEIHTAGTVFAIRSPRWAAREFGAAVRAWTGPPASPGFVPFRLASSAW